MRSPSVSLEIHWPCEGGAGHTRSLMRRLPPPPIANGASTWQERRVMEMVGSVKGEEQLCEWAQGPSTSSVLYQAPGCINTHLWKQPLSPSALVDWQQYHWSVRPHHPHWYLCEHIQTLIDQSDHSIKATVSVSDTALSHTKNHQLGQHREVSSDGLQPHTCAMNNKQTNKINK